MIKRALISVSDKTGLLELGKALKHFQVEILTTGGTSKTLQDATIPITSVSDYTGFPEMMDGRLKTLHPRVYGSLLGRREDKQHQEEANTYGIRWIDLVVVNLYPFEKVAAASKKPEWRDLIENIDIGGPSMIRAAAKNHEFVTVITDPRDYPMVIQRLKDNPNDPFNLAFRYEMAVKAFRYTALYDSFISQTLSHYDWDGAELKRKNFPTYHSFHGKLSQELRYGENPHQKAALYRMQVPAEKTPISKSLQGKEMSFNNLLDSDAAWRTLSELPSQSTVIIKHNNACGVGVGASALESYKRAFDADKESAFGGVVAISGTVDQDLAHLLTEHFYEIICAENFTMEAREVLQSKKNLRLIMIPRVEDQTETYKSTVDLKKIIGGYLVQDPDQFGNFNDGILGPDAQVVTKRQPTAEEMKALRLGWVVSKNIKSNGIVISSEIQTLGIGCGQVNRKFASESAASRAKQFKSDVKTCASDGFFPFADSLDILRDAGVTAIVQPGGSIRDQEVIDACNEKNLSMIFTKARHFSH
ncbi:MAG: bifunctional phosphoribosylaminoimidazolecarboxamide formyltransferase/IMP cyclohydrolase [Deltaproteobacteria bacterium]|nr:bifunctional phosphoribosylaminoimidazolecarboxamide formyltransferase/IMP cyclohydrolase [Deltaproteobacteria bacterium]